jgi:hypothetical protein
MAALTGSTLRTVEVDSDPELAVDFGLRVPVVRTGAGRVLAEGRIRPWRLLTAMARERVRRRSRK